MNNICITASRFLSDAARSLEKEFPSSQFQIKTGAGLRQEGLISFLKNFRSFEKAVFFDYDLDVLSKPLLWALILLWLAKKEAYFIDMQARLERVSYHSLPFRYLPSFLLEAVSTPVDFLKAKQNIRQLEKGREGQGLSIKKEPLETDYSSIKLAFLRTDHWFGIKSGGSVVHIAGVVNRFADAGLKVFILSTDSLQLIDRDSIKLHVVKPRQKYQFTKGLPELLYSETLIKAARPIFEKETPNLIYQRYSLNNYAGVALAKQFRLPFIVEYNGSFPWMARHWGRPLRFERTASKIELLNFRVADLIVVVSRPLKEELMARGIPENKILVNPNGVDPERYQPDIDGSGVRQHYGFKEKVVVGFIGTFGKWHGAEVLAKAAVNIINELNTQDQIHFLFIGDGVMLAETKRIVHREGIESKVTFTGLIPQEQSPEYLAACDILVSPHVPNPDGTPFFGSPTKLFEYMSMGKGIVASNLEQIGEVLEHKKTAWLVEPGNVDELAEGILTLVQNEKLKETLGRNARIEVMKKYTWEHHVSRTLVKLKEIMGL